MELNYNLLAIGDRLIRTKGGIFSKHHALYAGFDFGINQHLVAENQNGFGVRIVTLNQFLNEGELVRVEHYYYSKSAQRLIISKIKNLLGRAYDSMFYNCEHFVNDVLNGKVSSPQVKKGVGVVLGLFALAFLLGASSK